jgi:hypothetical protein
MLSVTHQSSPNSELICNGLGTDEPSHYGVTDKAWGIIFLTSLGGFTAWAVGVHLSGSRQEKKLDRYIAKRRKVLARRFS